MNDTRYELFLNVKYILSIMHKDKSLLAIVLFPFLPFLAFLIACTDLRKRGNGVVFVLFYGLFGFCHTFEDVRADSYRKMLDFTNTSSSSLIEIIRDYIDGDKMDIYQSWLFSWVSKITDNPHVMMMFVGLIGGFFSLLLLRRIMNDYKDSFNIYVCCILIVISLPISPVQMGGIRGFTALAVFSYAALKFIVDQKNIWIIPILCTPLIHFGYFVMVGAAIIIRIIPIKHNLLFWPVILACIASLFLDTSSWSGITGDVDTYIDNDAISYRTNHYADSDTDAEFNKSLTNKILDIQNKVIACFIAILLIYLKRNWHRFKHTTYSTHIYNYMLFFLFIGFTLISFSVVGQRYLYFGTIMICMYLLILYNQNRESRVKRIITMLPIVFLGNIAWTIYNSYYNTGIDIYIKTLPQLLL